MPSATHRPRPRLLAAGLLAALLAGCGSASPQELPPAAGPDSSPPAAVEPVGRVSADGLLPLGLGPIGAARTAVDGGARQAVVDGRAREVLLSETGATEPLARADAGVGPTRALSNGRWLWVLDTRGDALLVYRVQPELELSRRVYLPGAPFALALDPVKQRLWVTLTATNEVVEFPAHGRPTALRRFPTVRQPDQVGVDGERGLVYVRGADGLQRFSPGPL
ncbi:MAG: hypothetical protein H0V81_10955 [Solirubrobacterales bacterium]|nr:hypothetical protein [Solirubrobacterales bacterium]